MTFVSRDRIALHASWHCRWRQPGSIPIKRPDYLFFRFPSQPQFDVWESWNLRMGLAEATTREEIGALVMCVPSAR